MFPPETPLEFIVFRLKLLEPLFSRYIPTLSFVPFVYIVFDVTVAVLETMLIP